VAPGATILNYKVFPTGSLVGEAFQGVVALQQAFRDGVDVANCSWGIGATSNGQSPEAKAFNRAWNEGLVIVKSAGNDGPRESSMTSPADADGVIVVGATNHEGTSVPDYSSRGPTENGKRPHLAAPGGLPLIRIQSCLANGGVGETSHGTSLATPIVAGAAALLLQLFPNATPDEIRMRLVSICRAVPEGDPNAIGAGLLDLSQL
jgi:serine protease AprX